MPKDWGEKWETHFIPKPYDAIMNKSLLAIITVIVIGAVSVYAILSIKSFLPAGTFYR